MTRTKQRAGTSGASGDDKDVEEDLRGDYNCPFLILNSLEGEFFERWSRYEITPPHCLDWPLLIQVNASETMTGYLDILGLTKYAHMEFKCSTVLTQEFLTTLDVPADLSYCQFRLKEVPRKVNVALMCKIFGFHPKNVGESSVPPTFNPNAAWTALTGFENWKSGGMPAGFLRDHVIAILHKFLAYAVSGNFEANKVNMTELYLLHCAVTNTRVCAAYFLLGTFKNILATSRCRPTLPLVASVIAQHYKVFEPADVAPGDVIYCTYINFSELKAARIMTVEKRWFPPRNRACVKNYVNAIAAARDQPIPEREDTDLFDDAEYEDSAMPDAFGPGTSTGAPHHDPASSSMGELAQLHADFRTLQTDFGDFRTAMFQRQDRLEANLAATHTLLTEQAQLWRVSQEQAALHYQQVMENNRQMAALNQQWSNWALFDPPPPPDQQ